MDSSPTPRLLALPPSLPATLWLSFHPLQLVAGAEMRGSLSTSHSKSQQQWGKGPCYLGLDETKHSVIWHFLPEGSTTRP